MSGECGKVAFLKFVLNGGDPNALFQERTREQIDDLAARTDALIRNVVNARLEIEAKIRVVANRSAALPLLDSELQALRLANEKIEGLSVVLSGQPDPQIVAVLERQLVELRQVINAARGSAYL